MFNGNALPFFNFTFLAYVWVEIVRIEPSEFTFGKPCHFLFSLQQGFYLQSVPEVHTEGRGEE